SVAISVAVTISVAVSVSVSVSVSVAVARAGLGLVARVLLGARLGTGEQRGRSKHEGQAGESRACHGSAGRITAALRNNQKRPSTHLLVCADAYQRDWTFLIIA